MELMDTLGSTLTHCSGNFLNCQSLTIDFFASIAYTIRKLKKGVMRMKECDDITVDLDDLIFDEEDYYPSER